MTTERTETDPVLRVRDLRKHFDGIVALDGVDLEVRDGEIVGLIGPNGAGKSTTFNCIMGDLPATDGSVYLREENVTDKRTSALVNEGITRAYQIPRVFPDLTVHENVVINMRHRTEPVLPTAFTSPKSDVSERAHELIEFVGIDHLRHEPAGDLSTGQKKLLNIAATIIGDPEIVLLDEPTAGVNPGLIETIIDTIDELNSNGTTYLIVEHNMDVVKQLSDHLYVLANGTNLVQGPPQEALDDPQVLNAYFGE
ncbi:ABC transporter ATP-binding protein [Halovivax cerinus]|uniref:ABC transporter ATP-binding protein n=1 Tax=Halovivax cerinus TaxID=1487865 RepID=A0ABD5NRZ4_9EURY|nr:ABC transporter ATP-binding protein [Halovivax cerinus]